MSGGPEHPTPDDGVTRQMRFDERTGAADNELDLLPWIGWILGGYLVVWGLVALARAGFDGFGLFDPVVSVGVFHATRLMALFAILVGFFVWFGVLGSADAMTLRGMGAFLLVAGIVFMIEPEGFAQWLGTQTIDGFHWALLGLILIVFTVVPPLRTGHRIRE
jgi:hypothetical protein